MKSSSTLVMIATVLLFFAAASSVSAQTLPLVQGQPTPTMNNPITYSITLQQGNWNVVGVSGQSTDWTLTHGGATSATAGRACEFVLADGNVGTITGNSGTATATIMSGQSIVEHAATSTLNPGTAAMYNWNGDILYVWEVPIVNPGTYNISVGFTGSVSLATLQYAWFNPQSTASWLDRSQAVFVLPAGTPQTNYNITAAGVYSIVVFEDGSAGTTFGTVVGSVTPVGGNSIFQATSISVVNAPVTVAPGGTFQSNIAITNAGAASGSTSYSIYISTDNVITTADTLVFTGSTAVIPPAGVYNSTDTCTVPGATAGGAYYAGLYISPGNTAVTANQDVVVQSLSPPGPFTLVAPANGATGVVVNPTYSWTASAGATTYTLQVALDAGFTNIVINKTGIVGTSDTPTTTLNNNTLYYWQVIAVNGNGNTTATGAPWNFTTVAAASPPGAFNLIAPANGSTGVSLTPTYSWAASTGASTYTLQVALDAGFTNIVINKTGIVSTSDTPATALASGTLHYWQVIAVNSQGNTTSTGAPWSFTTTAGGSPPGAFTLVSPTNLSTGVSTSPTYSWNAAPNAVSYRLQVATDAGMTVLVIDKPGIVVPFDTPATALNSGTTYYWQVVASNGTGDTTSTAAPWSFTTSLFDPNVQSVLLLDLPVRVPRGGNFRVTRDIVNNGTAGGSVSYDLYLSTDGVIDASDLLVFTGMTGNIAPSAVDSLTLSCTVPQTAVEGQTYYVGLFLTPAKRIASADTLLVAQVEPESAIGCSGAGRSGRGAGGSLVPLALLGILLLLLRRRKVVGCDARN
jgi:hypothetical protein